METLSSVTSSLSHVNSFQSGFSRHIQCSVQQNRIVPSRVLKPCRFLGNVVFGNFKEFNGRRVKEGRNSMTLFPISQRRVLNVKGEAFSPFGKGKSESKEPSSVPRAGNFDSLEMEKTSKEPFKYNGVFLLLLLNLVIFVADHILHLPVVSHLYLYHSHPRWYQFVTATFCHANWNHLSANLFFVYIFGKLVEELEGSFGVWASYLITGVGANFFSWLLLPSSSVSVGASGAVFGLFAVSVLIRLSLDWRRLIEVLILGPFVLEKVIVEAQESANMSHSLLMGASVNHIAHLGGALVGALLILLLTKLPDVRDSKPKPKS